MSSMERDNWNERYAAGEYAYGTEPNRFFKEQLDILTPGKIYLPAEGEGRNAVYAAKHGWMVDAVDFSEQGKLKALKFASREKVNINYYINNLTQYEPPQNYYDAVGIVFLHLNSSERSIVYPLIIKSLKPDGVIIMEVFSKKKPESYKGGPRDPEYLYNLDDIKDLFKDLETIMLEEKTIQINEGEYHKGEAIVIRYMGKKKS